MTNNEVGISKLVQKLLEIKSAIAIDEDWKQKLDLLTSVLELGT